MSPQCACGGKLLLVENGYYCETCSDKFLKTFTAAAAHQLDGRCPICRGKITEGDYWTCAKCGTAYKK